MKRAQPIVSESSFATGGKGVLLYDTITIIRQQVFSTLYTKST
jgi:hypothetical protein